MMDPSHPIGEHEKSRRVDLETMARAVRDFLVAAGVDMTHPHLVGTPERVAKAWSDELLDGYNYHPAEILRESFAAEANPNAPPSSEIVLAKDISFHGLCPHHLLPFQGVAHIAYIPDGKMAPFSGLARLVDCFSHRLEVQETITRQVAESLIAHLGAKGAAVVLESEQTCMTVRGVKRRGTRIITTNFAGLFNTQAELRRDFLRLIGKAD
jgi:GTP cyclohydrolase I